jgi:DeoR family galactitol utilization operon repressor
MNENIKALSLKERENRIVRMLIEDPTITIARLSKELGVSPTTVSNDLNSLTNKGTLIKVKGSGIIVSFHPNILARLESMMAEKNRIGQYASSLVNDGDTIMVAGGTTTSLVVKYLLGKRDIRIITHSTLVIPYARVNPGIHITSTGGEFKASTETYVGPHAMKELNKFYAKTAFIGTDGLSLKDGLTTYLVEDAAIVKSMAERAERSVLVVDSSKINKRGSVKVLPLTEIDMVICGKGMPKDVKEELMNENVQVVLV